MAMGCLDGEGHATIRVGTPPVPITWDAVEFLALPVDAMGIIDSLTAAASSPPPVFPGLDSAMANYERPDPAAADDIHEQWVKARDDVRALSDSLQRVDRESRAYARLYATFRDRYDELVKREAALERALGNLTDADVALAERASAAADTLRAWEEWAFADLDSILDARIAASHRSEHRLPANTPELELHLEPGPWWLTARIPHPTNPFLEVVWNVPFTVNRLVPAIVPIIDRHVTLQWRH